MAYTKNNWVDNETTITANALNNIEAGIETVTNEASNIARDFARKTYVDDEITKVKTSDFYEHANLSKFNIPKSALDKRFKFDFPTGEVIKHKSEYYTYIFKNELLNKTDTVEGVYKINIKTNAIDLVKACNTDKYNRAYTVYNDGKMYIAGGILKSNKRDGSSTLYCYDFATNEFTKLPDITIESNMTGFRAAYAYENKLYLCGVYKYYNNQSSTYRGAIIYDTITKQWSKNDTISFTGSENISVAGNKIILLKYSELEYSEELKCNALRFTVEEITKDLRLLNTYTFDLSAKEAQYLPDYCLPLSETKFFSVASYCNGSSEGETGWYKQETLLFDLNNIEAKFQKIDDQVFDILPNKTFNGDYKVGICQEDLSIFLHTLENKDGSTISNGIYHVTGKVTNYTSNGCVTTEEALDSLFENDTKLKNNISTVENSIKALPTKSYIDGAIDLVRPTRINDLIRTEMINISKERFKIITANKLSNVVKYKDDYYVYIVKSGGATTPEGIYKIANDDITLVAECSTDKFSRIQLVLVGDKVYIFGGTLKTAKEQNGSISFYCYDFVTKEFTKLRDVINSAPNVCEAGGIIVSQGVINFMSPKKLLNYDLTDLTGVLTFDLTSKSWSYSANADYKGQYFEYGEDLIELKAEDGARNESLNCSDKVFTIKYRNKGYLPSVRKTLTFTVPAAKALYMPDKFYRLSSTKLFSVLSPSNTGGEGAKGWEIIEFAVIDLAKESPNLEIVKGFNPLGIKMQENVSHTMNVLEVSNDNGVMIYNLRNSNIISEGMQFITDKSEYRRNGCLSVEEAVDKLFAEIEKLKNK